MATTIMIVYNNALCGYCSLAVVVNIICDNSVVDGLVSRACTAVHSCIS